MLQLFMTALSVLMEVNMDRSRELIFTSNNKNVLVYNYHLNKACIISIGTYKNIFESDYSIDNLIRNGIIDDLSISLLIKNGVLFNNYHEYHRLSYAERLSNRKVEVSLDEVYLHLTQRCNLRCDYCYNKKNLNDTDFLTTDDILMIGEKLKKIDVKKITFTGGEALLRDDLEYITYKFKEIGFKLVLLTNGTKLLKNVKVLDNVDSVIVSLDTLRQNSNQRIGLNIESLTKDLSNIAINYSNKIYIRSVVSSINEHIWKEVERFSIDNGFKFISNIFIPNNISEVDFMPKIDMIEVDENLLNFSGNICGGCYKEISIDCKGYIYPCQALLNDKFKIVNIFDENWYNLLKESKITEEFKKRNVNNIEGCKDCEYKYLCGGGCRAIAFNVYDSLDAKAECICDYHKQIVKKKLEGLLNIYG